MSDGSPARESAAQPPWTGGPLWRGDIQSNTVQFEVLGVAPATASATETSANPALQAKIARSVAARVTGTLVPAPGDGTKWQVNSEVDEADITKLEPGQDAYVTLDAFRGRVFKGKVAAIADVPTKAQNVVTYLVVIQGIDSDPKFKQGMSANVSFFTAERASTLPSATRPAVRETSPQATHPAAWLLTIHYSSNPREIDLRDGVLKQVWYTPTPGMEVVRGREKSMRGYDKHESTRRLSEAEKARLAKWLEDYKVMSLPRTYPPEMHQGFSDFRGQQGGDTLHVDLGAVRASAELHKAIAALDTLCMDIAVGADEKPGNPDSSTRDPATQPAVREASPQAPSTHSTPSTGSGQASSGQAGSGQASSGPSTQPKASWLFPLGRAAQAKQTAAKTDIAIQKVSLDAFEVDCGRYPSTAEGLDVLVTNPAGLKGWKGPYIERLPKDPWARAYVYRCRGQHNPKGFDLYSLGPDGQEGTGDDITNWSDQPKNSRPSSPASSPAPGPAVREASPQATQPGSD